MSGDLLGLTERDRALLSEVTRFGVMSREQLVRLKFFRSKTRANERLRRLVKHDYLTTRHQALTRGGPRLIYLPGRALSDTQEARRRFSEASDVFLLHQLGLIDIRLAFEGHTTVTRWLSDKELAAAALGVIPDAFLEFLVGPSTFCAFVEYDRGTETLGRFQRKVRAYLDAAYSGAFERMFHRKYFRLLVVTDTDRRLSTLSADTARLTDKIVRLTTLTELTASGPLASIWRRPGASTSQSLTVS
jgi:hypothetical protein